MPESFDNPDSSRVETYKKISKFSKIIQNFQLETSKYSKNIRFRRSVLPSKCNKQRYNKNDLTRTSRNSWTFSTIPTSNIKNQTIATFPPELITRLINWKRKWTSIHTKLTLAKDLIKASRTFLGYFTIKDDRTESIQLDGSDSSVSLRI